MPMTTSITDCEQFADNIARAGGTVPDVLAHLLSSHQLLSRQEAAESPEKALMTAALNGSLDQKTLDRLLPAAATAALVDNYRGDLARRSEHVLVGEFHRQMTTAADKILDSMRERFDEHAAAIAHARSLIDPESDPEHILASGQSGLVDAWQGLNEHLAAITRIAVVARQFAPRLGHFPQIVEYANADNFRLSDSALMCTDGPLEIDSALFHQPDRGHRTSPFFRVPLRLHTIETARERYNAWAADEFDAQHSGRRAAGSTSTA